MRESLHPDVEATMTFLRQEGYVPHLDDDGDITFKCEGRRLYIFTAEIHLDFFQVVMPNIWRAESAAEQTAAAAVCNEMSATTKAAKVFLVDDQVHVTMESFHTAVTGFCDVFNRGIPALLVAQRQVHEAMRDWVRTHQAETEDPVIAEETISDPHRFN